MTKLLTGLLGAALLFAGSAGATQGGSSTAESRTLAAKAERLRSFGSCQDLLRYMKKHGQRIVGSGGLPASLGPEARTIDPVAPGLEAGLGGAPAKTGEPNVEFSGTNVQEPGVDELDIVKSNGKVILAIAQGKLWSVSAGPGTPRLLGSLPLGHGLGHELFWHGNRAVVISHGLLGFEPLPIVATGASIAPSRATTVLTEVDVSEPSQLRLVRTVTVDGALVDARLTGSTARIVTSSRHFGFDFVTPAGIGAASEKAAEDRNRSEIATSRLLNWLPTYELKTHRSGKTQKHMAVRCRAVKRPARFSGLGMLTVLTLDLRKGIKPVESDAVIGDGRTVYASANGLYIATQRWISPVVAQPVRPSQATVLHKFDTSRSAKTSYRASGAVSGFVLNQWSMSEREGLLRVATTETPTWWPGVPRGESESFVSVFAERAGRLVQIGSVGGLGRGERIFGVRFIGDVGYVVTFRRIDPLYTVDLSSPRDPRVRGFLKMLGYSSYLHPLGSNALIGLGQNATAEGRTIGTQLSVFDVGNPANPRRLHQATVDRGWSEAEWDHHAFLYWPARNIAVFPAQAVREDGSAAGVPVLGALAFQVDRRGIRRLGLIEHPGFRATTGVKPKIVYPPPIRRAVVVGSTLFTISAVGIKASALDSLDDRAWVPFG